MNVLNRDLQVDEKVVDTDGNVWLVSGGFGMNSFTRGSAIYATRERDGAKARIEDIIDAKATNALQPVTERSTNGTR